MTLQRLGARAWWPAVLAFVACAGRGAIPARPVAGTVAPEVAAPLDSAAAARERSARDSTEASAHLRRGLAALQQGRDAAAEVELGMARRLQPPFAESFGGLALISARTGLVPAALALVDTAVALGDTSTYLVALRGRLLAEARRCPEAVKVLEPLVRVHPEWTSPTPELSRCYLSLGRATDAVPLMQRAVRREPAARPLRYALIDAFTAARQLDSALAHARILTERDPENGLWWTLVGRVLFLQNDIAGARAAFEHGFRMRPGLADSLPRIDRDAWRALQDLPRSPPR